MRPRRPADGWVAQDGPVACLQRQRLGIVRRTVSEPSGRTWTQIARVPTCTINSPDSSSDKLVLGGPRAVAHVWMRSRTALGRCRASRPECLSVESVHGCRSPWSAEGAQLRWWGKTSDRWSSSCPSGMPRTRTGSGAAPAGTSRTTIALDVGQLLPRAVESNGTSGLVSG